MATYEQKHKEWVSWLSGDEHHAIERQIASMLWNDMSYRTLLLPREYPESEPTFFAARNAVLAQSLDQGYVAMQMLAIRKLTEPTHRSSARGVISVHRLLSDIEQHREVLTREAYVSHGGFSYAPALSLAELWQRAAESAKPNDGLLSEASQAPIISYQRHATFDLISKVSPDFRQPNDTIHASTFLLLWEWFDKSEAKTLIDLGNKYVMHAADEISRNSLTDVVSLSKNEFMRKLAIAQEHIVRAVDVIRFQILGIREKTKVVPYPQNVAFLKGLDAPYASDATLMDMRSRWDRLELERDAWVNDTEKAFQMSLALPPP